MAQHFGESATAAAPATPQMPGPKHATLLQRWLVEARIANDGSAAFRRGIPILEHLLRAIVPEKTDLLPNYPNPFNPETWFPYRLAQDSEVMIRIWDVQGQLVRTLGLGYQPAGYYLSRERAAYWDGRNYAGERVASGVYLYQLVTPSFQQMRRLVVVK